jgi:hypothetical protein
MSGSSLSGAARHRVSNQFGSGVASYEEAAVRFGEHRRPHVLTGAKRGRGRPCRNQCIGRVLTRDNLVPTRQVIGCRDRLHRAIERLFAHDPRVPSQVREKRRLFTTRFMSSPRSVSHARSPSTPRSYISSDGVTRDGVYDGGVFGPVTFQVRFRRHF